MTLRLAWSFCLGIPIFAMGLAVSLWRRYARGHGNGTGMGRIQHQGAHILIALQHLRVGEIVAVEITDGD